MSLRYNSDGSVSEDTLVGPQKRDLMSVLKLSLHLTKQDRKLIEDFCRRTQKCPDTEVTISSLTEMLLQDVAYAIKRPGSWEGSNMIQVLTAHGYGEEI